MWLREWRDVLRRASGRGTYPHELAFLLENPLRSLVFSRRTLIRRLRLDADSRVLELGPGPGYFSVAVARSVPLGRLELFDLQLEMLCRARRKIRGADLRNVGFTRGDGTALPYRTACFDRVFLVAVLGEVPDPPACLAEIRRVLRPGGSVSVTELPGDPDFTPLAELREMAESQGLELTESFGRPRSFTASFRKTSP